MQDAWEGLGNVDFVSILMVIFLILHKNLTNNKNHAL